MTGPRKKPDQSFTIMIVPHSGDKPFSFPFRTLWLKVMAAVLGAVVLSMCVFAVKYTNMSRTVGRNEIELSHLRRENTNQKELLEKLQSEAAEVRERLSRVEALDAQVREIIGRERSLFSLRPDPSQMTARSQEQRVALAEVSRDGASVRRQGLFESAIDLASVLEENLVADQRELKDLVVYLRAKPSAWPAPGTVTSGFGPRRSPITGAKDFHEGLDIGARYGTQVSAAGDGVIVSAGWRGGLGSTVVIDHGYGIRSWYCHLSRILVKAGQKVERKQAIGLVGSSGSSTGPHLHFQVTVNGECVDPAKFLSSVSDL